MSNLLVLALLKKEYGDGKRRYTSSTKSSTLKEKSQERYHSDYKYEYEAIEYVYRMILNTPELRDFFTSYGASLKKIDEIDKGLAVDEMQAYSKEYIEQKEKCAEMAKQVIESGIDFTSSIKGPKHYSGVKTTEPYGFGGKGEYSYNEDCFFCQGFNGVRVTLEMLQDTNNNPYENEFERWQEQNPDINVKIDELKSDIENKKRRLKLTLFKRDEKKEEIENLEQQLENIQKEYDDGMKKKKEMEIFVAFTPEQKEVIANYLKETEKCEKIGEKIRESVNYAIEISMGTTMWGERSDRYKNRNKCERALKDAFENGTVTDEQKRRVDEILLSVDVNGRYDTGARDYDLNKLVSYSIHDGVRWYFNKIVREKALAELKEKDSILTSLTEEAQEISSAENRKQENEKKNSNSIGE